jgi:hypothetical protein
LRSITLAFAAAFALAALAAGASAEPIQQGNLRVFFEAQLAPRARRRSRSASPARWRPPTAAARRSCAK